jgi:proteasome lid subunit RPN8/RPN11
MKQNTVKAKGTELRIQGEVVRQIRQHARGSMKAEVCGVLIGSEQEDATVIEACISGAKAVQGGAHVTFTQDTWEHIYAIKDRDYPNDRIVGWYHSHPGFGVFLSEHDAFIHRNFFSAPKQVAWVYDPHSDEEGCFGWIKDDLVRLHRIVLLDGKGGEFAGETGKPEPLLDIVEEPEPAETKKAPQQDRESLLRFATTTLGYLIVFTVGFMLSWLLFPHFVGIPVDPRTGQPLIGSSLPAQPGQNAAQSKPGTPQAGKQAQSPEVVKEDH